MLVQKEPQIILMALVALGEQKRLPHEAGQTLAQKVYNKQSKLDHHQVL